MPEGEEFREEPDIETEKWGHNPDTWMVILTALLMFIGVGTAWIFYGQFREMKTQTGIINDQAKQAAADTIEASKRADKQLELIGKQASAAQDSVGAIQRQMRQDQRPWLGLQMDWPPIKSPSGEVIGKLVRVTENQPLTVPMQLTTTGKTVARRVLAKIFIEVVKTSESPHLDSSKPPAWGLTAGIIVPNAPSNFFAHRLLPKKTGLEAMSNLTPSENQELSAGRAYLAIYGTMTYTDVFDISHWTRFCSWVPLNSAPRFYNSKTCSRLQQCR
jgi:hypothetical protein